MKGPVAPMGAEAWGGEKRKPAGRLIPVMSVEQYAGTLARLFGLSGGQIQIVSPNSDNFGSSPYLDFLG